MKNALRIIWLMVVWVGGSGVGWGQFTTPTIDATLDLGNYPNNFISGTSTWYLTWNNTDLFVFLQNANQSEPVSIFLDVDPMVPVNGGTNTNGNLVGINYDGYTVPPNLPIRADILIYAHNGYREIFHRNGSGGWMSLGGGGDGICGGGISDYTGNANGQYSSNDNGNGNGGDDRREFRISWGRLLGTINGGLRPTSFNWFGYASYNNGMYAQVPTENYNGNNVIGNTNGLVRYYTVSNTANGASTNPFSRNSYTHPLGVTNNAFGAIGVWDFTMNSTGQQIARLNTGGDWVINGNLVVGNGTVFFGSGGIGYGTTTVNNVNVLGDGSLNMDQTNKVFSVTGNIEISSTSANALVLSGTSGGDLYVNGNFTKTAGTFNCNSRQLRFTGTGVQSYSSNVTENINFIRNAKPSSTLTINSSINLPVSGNAAVFDANTNTTFSSGTTVTLAGGTTFTANNAGSTVTINGTIDNSGTITGSAATLSFSSTGIYNHNLNGGVIPFATWNASSNCNITGVGTTIPTASTFAQTFGNLTWNCIGQTAIANFTGNLTSIAGNLNIQSTGSNVFRLNTSSPTSVLLNIGGELNQSGGTIDLTNGTSTVTLNVSGNFIQSGGTLNGSITSSGTGVLNITGNFNQTGGTINGSTASGIGTFNVTGNFTQSAGTLNGTTSTGTANFNILGNFSQTGGTINLGGGSSTGTGILRVAGNFNQSSGTIDELNTSVNHTIEFNGTSNQSISIAGAVNNRINFRCNNNNGITLLTNLTINQDATFFRSRGSIAGTINYNTTNSTLSYDGESLTTSDVEWPTSNGPISVTLNTSAVTNIISLHDSRNLSDLTASLLTLTSGILDLGNSNLTLNRGAAAALSGGSLNSYISYTGTGRMTRTIPTGASTILFPIGTSTNYTPFGLTFTANTILPNPALRTVSVNNIAGNLNIFTPNTPPDYLNRYFTTTVNHNDGSYSYRISTLGYIPVEVNGDINEIKISSFNGTGWTDQVTIPGNPLTSSTGTFTQANAPLSSGHFSGRNSSALYTWNGSTSNSWDVTTNWSPAGFPSPTDRILVDNAASNPLVITDAKTISTATFEGTGVVTVAGTGSLQATTFALQGTAIFNLQSGSSLTLTGTTITYASTATANFDCNSTVNYSGAGAQTIMPVEYGNLTLSGGTKSLATSQTIFICNAYNVSAATTYNTGSTIVFDGTSPQIIPADTYINLQLSNASGDYCTIGGAITVSSSLIVDAGSKLNTGSNVNLNNSNSIINGIWQRSAGNFIQTSGTLIFNSNAIYEHNQNGNSIPPATWNTGSTCEILGITTTIPSNLTQNFHHFRWNCAGQTTGILGLNSTLTSIAGNFEIINANGNALSLSNANPVILTVGGNVVLQGGSIHLTVGAGNPTLRIGGNLTIDAVRTITKGSGGGVGLIEFNGGNNQLVNIPATSNISGQVNFRVNNPAGITIPTGNVFPVNGGTTLQISQGNVALQGTASIVYGNLPSLAVLEYNPSGTTAITTNGEWPLTGMRRVRINSTSSAAITLNDSREIGSDALDIINFDNGRLVLGVHNLILTNRIGGALTVANGYIETNGSGSLIREVLFNSSANYLFPVGNGSYTPVLYNSFLGTTDNTQISVRSVGVTHPDFVSSPPADYLQNRYWVTNVTPAAANYTYLPIYTFIANDIFDNPTNVRLSRWNSSSWTNLSGSSVSGNSLISGTLTQTTGNLFNAQWSGRVIKLPTTYTWNISSGGSWTTAANWNPNGIPGSEDIVQFTHAGNYDITSIPTEINLAGLSFSGNGTTNLFSGGTGTISISGGTDALTVGSNATMVVRGLNASNWILLAGSTGTINGTVRLRGENSNTAHTLQAESANGITFLSGSKFEAGVLNTTNYSGNPFGADATAGSVVFENGSVFEQFDGGSPFGNNNVAVFQPGSLYRFSDNSITVPSFSGRTYANFEYNSSLVAGKSVLGGSAFTIDNLSVAQGIFNINVTGTPGHAILGNITVANGANLNFSPASAATVNLSGNGIQNISGAGGITVNANATLQVTNFGGGVNLQKNITVALNGNLNIAANAIFNATGSNVVSGSGTFNLQSDGLLGVGSPDGLFGSANSGNVQTSIRTISSNASVRFNGIVPQVTGNIVTSPAVNTLKSLIIANALGVSLSPVNNDLNVTTLSLESGNFSIGIGQNVNIVNNGTVAATSGNLTNNAAGGAVSFAGTGTVSVSASGVLNFYNVNLPAGSGGVNFGAGGSPTITNELVINQGRFIQTHPPFYANTSTLVYNTAGSFGAASEWTPAAVSGRGVPQNIQVGTGSISNTVLNFSTSPDNTWRQCNGNFTIGTSGPSTGIGFIQSTSRDLRIGGDWNRFSSGTFYTPNAGAVWFVGSNTTTANQFIRVYSGSPNWVETFSYLILNNTATNGSVSLSNIAGSYTDVSVDGNNSGNFDQLQLLSANPLDLNGRTMYLTGSPGGFLLVDGGIRTIKGSIAADPTLYTGGTLFFQSNKAVKSMNAGTLLIDKYVTVNIDKGLQPTTGIDFGPNTTTIDGTLQLLNGGFVSTNAPFYSTTSLLKYNSGNNSSAPYNRVAEWSAGTSVANAGFPHHVQISGNTYVLPAGSGNAANNLFCGGNLTIDPGSTFDMSYNGATNLTADLRVDGNISISGSFICSQSPQAGDGDVFLAGNWVRENGGGFTPNNKAVFFIGNQSTAISRIGGTETFPYAIINKTGGANTTLTLASPVNIDKKLTLTSGKLITSTTNILSIINNEPDGPDDGVEASDGFTAVGYIEGPMVRNVKTISGTQSYLFPVGKLEGATHLYKRMRMRDVTGTSSFRAEYIRNEPPGPAPLFFQDNILGILKDEYWNVTRSGTASARLILPYSNPGIGGWLNDSKGPISPPLDANVAVLKGTAPPGFPNDYNWNYTGPDSSTFNNEGLEPQARYFTLDGDIRSRLITEFSPFTIGFGYNSVLPLRLLTFTAALHGPDALLHWQLADAKDLLHFEVEHSTDGQRFSRLAIVQGNGGTQYNYRHTKLAPGVHYYRLQMVEKDGRRSQSKTEVLMVHTNQTLITGLLQNPVPGGQAIVRAYSATHQDAHVLLMDMTGRVLLRQKLRLQAGYNQPSVSVMLFPAGMYKLVMRTDDGVEKVMTVMK